MEQTETLQMQILKTEELPADNNVKTVHVADLISNYDAKTAKENDQDLSSIASTLSMDKSNVESTLDDGMDVNSSVISSKEIDADTLKQINSETNKPDMVNKSIRKETDIEIYEHTKDELIDSDHGSSSLSNVEGQNQDVITESKIVETDEKEVKNDVNTIEDANQSSGDEYSTSNKSVKQDVHDAHESFKETAKNIHDNDSNQNNAIVTDAELTKLVHEDTEIVVVVENVPVTTADNFIVTLDEKNIDKECEQNTVMNLQEKKTTESGHENDEFNLIDCNQENDNTIIEVISTEIIHTPITEQCEKQSNKKCIKSNKCDIDAVNITEGEVAISKSKNDEIVESKMLDSKKINTDSQKFDTESSAAVKNVGPKTKDLQREDFRKNTITKDKSEANQEKTSVHETIADSSSKKRSVIQDIFDDWGVENIDEDAQSTSKIHDSVEIELKSLLDEAKIDQTATNKLTISAEKTTNKEHSVNDTSSVRTSENVTKKSAEQTKKQKKINDLNQDTTLSLNKNEKDSSAAGKTSGNVDSLAFNTTPSHSTIPKNRSRHLTSQIASPAEVTEVLKERLREKQKIIDAPRGPDIFFVKKLTQRLSSKLAGGPVNPVPALIPLPQQSSSLSQSTQLPSDKCDKKTTDNTTETSKDGNSDNKELLAILEGDVDPDWSNLKPPILIEEGKISSNNEHSDHSSPPKLDPLVERELALKQLLELPVTIPKKNPSRKKKALKSVSNKSSKDVGAVQEQTKIIDDLTDEDIQQKAEDAEMDSYSSTCEHSDNQKEQNMKQEVRVEESRSGRKRKLTEKAREHEQNTIKRQKIHKGKVSINKKQSQENNSASDDSLTTENHVTSNMPETETIDNEQNDMEEVENKKAKVDTILNKTEHPVLKRSKQNLRKGSQSITKRKIVVKKLLRQKMTTNNKSAKLKSPKKSKIVPKSQKRTIENIPGDIKPKKKIINEIDRLLQDEGVVNLLYDVEQPDKKRLIPITKSRAKVMDLQKVQRELKIRKKLVRNAVLRLRTPTTGVTKVSQRSKRTVVHDIQADKKAGEQVTSPKSQNIASPTELILPAKIRNAADASIIVRRHSSSSFSSASGSPRVSIDSPADLIKLDDGAAHSLRSTKRKHSQDEKINMKKSKKKTSQKSDGESIATGSNINITTAAATTNSNITTNNTEEKIAVTVATRPTKKSEMKKVDKAAKYQENISVFKESISSSKVTTRSNGTATGKMTAKNRRALKNKAFARASNSDNAEELTKEEDELSACLAEAATALSIVSATGRSGNVTATRKSKDTNSTKAETQGQFSNKEINVRRHGNLVQLILTPSSSTKIRNALTLQVMQEFKEALSILKRDDECRVVLLTSTGTSFCEGLELSTLLHTNKEERRALAQELAYAVKDFIKSLATFNKPIVAGVQGAAIGLGVTMLPLFDLVIASDKATFCTPYGKLGQIAEGAAVFTLSHILGSAITSELLLGGRTLTASEALRAGLVTRVLWPDRFQVELLPSLRAMSDQSSQSMEATKALLRHSLRKKLDAALESETYLLIQHWCSADCQNAIKAYVDGKIQ